LRTVKFKQPKHGLLTRHDYTTQHRAKNGDFVDIEKVDYSTTKKYNDFVDEGCLLVIDEIQNIKNMTCQLYACKTLIGQISNKYKENKNCNSRVLLLSGSPADKREQIVHFYRLLGIMESDRLSAYNISNYEMIWKGMQEIEDFCTQNFALNDVKRIKETSGLRTDHQVKYSSVVVLERYCYNLFVNLIRPNLSHSMTPMKLNVKINKYNAYYVMKNADSIALLDSGLANLSDATHFNRETQTVDFADRGIDGIRGVTIALMMIETSKIDLFVRIAKDELQANKKLKLCICVNYTETVNDIINLLSEFKPLRLNGSMTLDARVDVLEKFQRNDDTYRLLVGNVSVCSSGIDLDDQYGGFPRLCLVSPNYSTITLYQLSHRFYRVNTKSDTNIHFVLCESHSELPILNALARKSAVMKDITKEQVENGVIFPGDYPAWHEKN
jgi:hypothetical protein